MFQGNLDDITKTALTVIVSKKLRKFHALTQRYDHSFVMPFWLVLMCQVPEMEKSKSE